MHFDEWIKERKRREWWYRRACRHAQARLSFYLSGGDNLLYLFNSIRAVDRAYLRWCEMDHVEVGYD